MKTRSLYNFMVRKAGTSKVVSTGFIYFTENNYFCMNMHNVNVFVDVGNIATYNLLNNYN